MAEANVDPTRWLKMFPKHFELLYVKYWVIEQKSYGDKTPMKSVRIDLERLKQNYNFV